MRGANYAFYQMNALDVDYAVNKLRMSPDLGPWVRGMSASNYSR